MIKTPKWLAVFICATVVAVVITSCSINVRVNGSSNDVPKEIATIIEAYKLLKEHDADKTKLNDKKLAQGAIEGMIKTLDEPFTGYIPPAFREQVREQLDGTFSGIGAEISMKSGMPTIIAPFPKSPAQKSGVLPGDVISKIDGTSIEGLALEEVIKRVRGEKGTKVIITFLRGPDKTPIELTITRDVVMFPSVTLENITDGIATISIAQFAKNTGYEIE